MNKKRNIFLGSLMLISSSLSIMACGAKHKFDETWSHDETSHWHACLVEGHEDTKDQADHDFNEWEIKTPAGVHVDRVETRSCKVCQYVEERTISDTGYHSYSNEWSYDENQHWHACTYEGCTAKSDATNHTLTVVEEVPATCNADGVAKHQICDCGALIDMTGKLVTLADLKLAKDTNKHTYTAWVEEVASSCVTQTDGTKGHYDCTVCGKHFDANKNEIADLTIEWAHTDTLYYHNNDSHCHKCSVCGAKGYDNWYEFHTSDGEIHSYDRVHYNRCTVCNYSINVQYHTFGDPVVTTPATYAAEGSQTETCTVCGYEKVSAIPALALKDRTVVYTGPNEKTYDGQAISFSGCISLTSTSSDTTQINYGQKKAKAYTDPECTNLYDIMAKTKDVGKYYIKCEWDASTAFGWAAASIIVPFEIKPIVLTTFTPGEVLKVKSSDISSDGVVTLGEDTSVTGQSVKATVKLANYSGLGTYSFAYSDISISDADGSTTTDYLKNYVVTNNGTSETDKVNIKVYDELVNSFTVKEVVSATSDTSTGKNYTTFEIKPNLAANTTLCLTIGDKLSTDLINSFATITKVSYGVVSNTQVGTTAMIYASQTDASITCTILGGYSSNYILARTFTLHTHDYNEITGACVCGETYAQEIISEETAVRVSADLKVVDHKAYFNFNRCANISGVFDIRVHGGETDFDPIESIDIYSSDATKIGSFTYKNSSMYESVYEHYYELSTADTKLLTANTQYYVVITLKEACTFDTLTCDVAAPFHRYQGQNECECGATKK